MNAKSILLALLVSGSTLGIAVASAQDLIEYALQPGFVQSVQSEFDCTLALKEGGQSTPVRVKAARPLEAERNAVAEAQRRTLALAVPARARCSLVQAGAK